MLVTCLLGACALAHEAGLAAPDVTADDGARVVRLSRVAPRIIDLTIASPAMGRDAVARLIVPRSFDRRPTARWPVLYLLHGCCADYQSWTRETDVARLSALGEVLVVMPEAGKAGFYSDWPTGPAWETYHLTELRQLLERGWRASERRAVAGLSMGGFGALSYAARHPGLFAAAASFSGILDTQLMSTPAPFTPDLVRFILRINGEPLDGPWGDPSAAAGAWTAHNPFALAAQLRGVALYVAAGDGEPGPLDKQGAPRDELERLIHTSNVAFLGQLAHLGIPVETDLYGRGTHTWGYWQRALHRAAPLLVRALTQAEATDGGADGRDAR